MAEKELSIEMVGAEATVDKVEKPQASGFDFQKVMASPAFWPGVIMALGIGLVFWPLIQGLPELWLSKDGYYSHGFLVPLIAGFIVFKNWDRKPNISGLMIPAIAIIYAATRSVEILGMAALGFVGLYTLIPPFRKGLGALNDKIFPEERMQDLKPKFNIGTFLFVGLLMLVPMFAALVSTATPIDAFMSASFVASALLAIWLVAGFRWMLALAWPVTYLAFGLPVFGMAIEIYTNPLQALSTTVAELILKVTGFDPYPLNATEVLVGTFHLNVGVPCSGLRLLFALTAFTTLFVLIANLRWWANLIMLAIIVPLALVINGLRIALIGMVGALKGDDAAMTFHDWSGYITLVVCFLILFKFARLLGWKD